MMPHCQLCGRGVGWGGRHSHVPCGPAQSHLTLINGSDAAKHQPPPPALVHVREHEHVGGARVVEVAGGPSQQRSTAKEGTGTVAQCNMGGNDAWKKQL